MRDVTRQCLVQHVAVAAPQGAASAHHNHPRAVICSGRGDAQYGVPYGTDGSGAGEWPWNAYTRRASRRQGT
jgi:hypothetical protein